MATFACDSCKKEVRFLTLQNATLIAGVCRSTMYYWIERGWVHWRQLPSGRRLICCNSLSRPGSRDFSRGLAESALHESTAERFPVQNFSSKTVQD